MQQFNIGSLEICALRLKPEEIVAGIDAFN
jgi:hypothetical protein